MLCQQWGHYPEVTGIDIGFRPIAGDHQSLALRIHLARPADRLWLERRNPLPTTIKGIPISVVIGRYQPLNQAKPSSAVSKCSIEAAGLGFALSRYLTQQNPLSGRSHELLAQNAGMFDILAPSSDHGDRAFNDLIATLERSLAADPSASASVVCYQHGAMSDDKISLYVKNMPRSDKPRRYRVDGIGHYRCEGVSGLASGMRVRAL